MSRAWEAGVNAEFVASVQKIVLEWQDGDLDDREAMEKIEYIVEVTG